jgi:hypothetical protein
MVSKAIYSKKIFFRFKVALLALMTSWCLAAGTDMAAFHRQELNSYLQEYNFLTKPIICNEMTITRENVLLKITFQSGNIFKD